MLNQRLESLRREMQAQQIDCLALVPGYNLRYLSGIEFMLFERPFLTFLPADPGVTPALVIPELEASTWQEESPFDACLFPWKDEHGPEEAMRQAAQALAAVRTLAVEHLRMRVMEYEIVQQAMPRARVVKGEEILNRMRMRKDAGEIALLQAAARIGEQALEEVVSAPLVGRTEREICNRLTAALLASGGETVPVEPLVLSGPRSAMPHGRTGSRRVAAGDLLLFDFVTTVGGYHSDITRTFVVGRAPDRRQREVYAAVQAANRAGRAAVRPGAACQEVDRAARRALVGAGLGDYFLHRTGHGLGLDVHEAPSIVEGNQMPLEEGMVFSVEPGAYLEGWGGIRIEDDVLVAADGCQSLTTFGRDLRVIAG
jgi:Xaa-Pro dipeptidase